jgi:predicted GIY-YIG superfamily endonuclease
MIWPPPAYSARPAALYLVHTPVGVYVGISVDPERRFRQHVSGFGSRALRRDALEHGPASLVLEVLGWFQTWQEARVAECDAIEHLKSEGLPLYNAHPGGGGGVLPNGGGIFARYRQALAACEASVRV